MAAAEIPSSKQLSVAVALLDKARSSCFDAEKEVFAAKAYEMIGAYLQSRPTVPAPAPAKACQSRAMTAYCTAPRYDSPVIDLTL